jgi:hypothetical protein
MITLSIQMNPCEEFVGLGSSYKGSKVARVSAWQLRYTRLDDPHPHPLNCPPSVIRAQVRAGCLYMYIS